MTENTFTMRTWNEDIVSGEEDGPQVAYAHATFTYTGLIEGTSIADSLLFYAGPGYDGGGTTSPGLERIEGSADGRKGSFIIRHEYSFAGHDVSSTFTVVPGSGTGELAGLTGAGTVAGSSETMSYTFEPELPMRPQEG